MSLLVSVAVQRVLTQLAVLGFPIHILGSGISLQTCQNSGSCTNLFSYATSAIAFLFIIACILIFVFIYDNMRRGRKVATTT